MILLIHIYEKKLFVISTITKIKTNPATFFLSKTLDILTSLLTQSYISITTPSSIIIKNQNLQVIVSLSIPGLLEFPESNNLQIKTESLETGPLKQKKKP